MCFLASTSKIIYNAKHIRQWYKKENPKWTEKLPLAENNNFHNRQELEIMPFQLDSILGEKKGYYNQTSVLEHLPSWTVWLLTKLFTEKSLSCWTKLSVLDLKTLSCWYLYDYSRVSQETKENVWVWVSLPPHLALLVSQEIFLWIFRVFLLLLLTWFLNKSVLEQPSRMN